MARVQTLAVLCVVGLFGLQPAEAVRYDFETPISGDTVPVHLDLRDAGEDSVAVLVSVPAGRGDLLGLFGNVDDEALLPAMTVEDASGLVSDAQFQANGVTQVGGGNNVNPVKKWDFGLRFGSAGTAGGRIESVAFRLSAPGLSVARLLAADNAGWLFGVRLQATDGAEGGSKMGLSAAAPRVAILDPGEGALRNGQPITVRGSVEGEGVVVTVNGVPATLDGNTFEAAVPLVEGPNTLTAVAANALATATESVAVILDTIAPQVTLSTPLEGVFVVSATPTIAALFSEERTGIDRETARILIDGVDRTAAAAVTESGLSLPSAAPLGEGLHAILVSVRDRAGNEGSVGWSFTVDTVAPALALEAPMVERLIATAPPEFVLSFADRTAGADLATFQLTVGGLSPTCRFEPTRARCTVPGLPSGPAAIVAALQDRAGNLAEVHQNFEFFRDQSPPSIAIESPAPGGFTNAPVASIRGRVTDDSGEVESVLVNGVPAVVEGDQFSADVPLREGSNAFLAVAVDTVGRQGTATSTAVLDTELPSLSILRPFDGQFVNRDTILLQGEAADDQQLAALRVNGEDLAVVGEAFSTSLALADGVNLLQVEAVDGAGNRREASLAVTRFSLPEVTITAPANLTNLSAPVVDVAGTVSDPGAAVTVNGVTAELSGLSFLARDVPLAEGGNVLTVTVRDGLGHVATASVSVLLDRTAPRVFIERPAAGEPVFTAQVTVAGLVNDIVPGTVNADNVTVTVNGQAARVGNRSFVAEGIPIDLGETTIEVVAQDENGNVGRASTVVERRLPDVPHILPLGGDGQMGAAGEALAQPLVVGVFEGGGQPAVGATVIFKVTNGDGRLDGERRQIAVPTGADGQAVANFHLGGRSGAGVQTVTALAPGFAGRAIFSADVLPGPPALIVVDSGDQQVGIAGRSLPRPLVATVTDRYFNRLEGVPVTFTVVQGLGQLVGGGARVTDSDGRALAELVLDPEEGAANTVVEATIDTLPGSPVAGFVATARTAGQAAATSVSGVVLDNSNVPVPGVTVHIRDTALSTATNSEGVFAIAGAPVGTIHLEVDGSTTSRAGTWPHLDFELTTVPGRDNTLGMPVFLLPLDLEQGVEVGPETGGVLTLEEFPGFALEIAPGSVTFLDGSHEGLVSATVVHSDKVPMVPNFGQQPRFIVTIQPAGALFDPPARLTLPNVEGLAPGQVTEFYSFDHDLGQFVSIGPGSVSEDGLTVVSNPGVGILKAGWHCGGDPSSSGTPHDCPDCYKCVNNRCEEDNGASCDDGDDCTVMDKCEGGACQGEKKEIKMLEALGNGMTSVEEFIDKDISFTSNIDEMHCDSIDYEWDLGDGNTASGASTTHKYEKPGTYNVTLTAQCDDCDDETANVSATIKCPDVEIDGATPDITEVCPGCDIQYSAKTDPPGYTIHWSLTADLGGQASVDSSGKVSISSTAPNGTVTVRASALMDGSDCFDERSVTVFKPDGPPKSGSRTQDENRWIRNNLWCAFRSRNLSSECIGETARRFGTTQDGSRANAFQHAYCNCLTASRCGDAAARELWDAHENYQGNPCTHGSMDLHNNAVGRSVSTGDASMCGMLVMNALNSGQLRWMDPVTSSGCPTIKNTP